MATPLHFISSNDQNTSSTNTTNIWPLINPTQPNHYPILRPVPNSNPKPRGRKSGVKFQNGNKNKVPLRGVGMAELERLRTLDEQQQHSLSTHTPTTTTSSYNVNTSIRPVTYPRVNPSFHHSNPLSGVPVIRYCLPGQSITDSTLTHRVGIPESASAPYFLELPSMPNPIQLDHHSTLSSFKKKRVIGEEAVGFSKGYNGHFGGFDPKNGDNYNHYLAPNHGVFSANPTINNGSEVVAIHKKRNGSGNVMMEYGFFPGKSEENMIKFDRDDNDNSNNYYHKMEDLNLKMGFFSASSSASPSPSSSLSSLTTATTTTTSNTSVDLSLKLSTY